MYHVISGAGVPRASHTSSNLSLDASSMSFGNCINLGETKNKKAIEYHRLEVNYDYTHSYHDYIFINTFLRAVDMFKFVKDFKMLRPFHYVIHLKSIQICSKVHTNTPTIVSAILLIYFEKVVQILEKKVHAITIRLIGHGLRE